MIEFFGFLGLFGFYVFAGIMGEWREVQIRRLYALGVF